MSDHRFKIGQTVSYTSGPYGRGGASGCLQDHPTAAAGG